MKTFAADFFVLCAFSIYFADAVHIFACRFVFNQFQIICGVLLRTFHVNIKSVFRFIAFHSFSVRKIFFSDGVEEFCKFFPLFCIINTDYIEIKAVRFFCNRNACKVFCLHIPKISRARVFALWIYGNAYAGSCQYNYCKDCNPCLRLLESCQCLYPCTHFLLSTNKGCRAEDESLRPRRCSHQSLGIALLVSCLSRRVVVAIDFHVAAKSSKRQPNHRIPPKCGKEKCRN